MSWAESSPSLLRVRKRPGILSLSPWVFFSLSLNTNGFWLGLIFFPSSSSLSVVVSVWNCTAGKSLPLHHPVTLDVLALAIPSVCIAAARPGPSLSVLLAHLRCSHTVASSSSSSSWPPPHPGSASRTLLHLFIHPPWRPPSTTTYSVAFFSPCKPGLPSWTCRTLARACATRQHFKVVGQNLSSSLSFWFLPFFLSFFLCCFFSPSSPRKNRIFSLSCVCLRLSSWWPRRTGSCLIDDRPHLLRSPLPSVVAKTFILFEKKKKYEIKTLLTGAMWKSVKETCKENGLGGKYPIYPG